MKKTLCVDFDGVIHSYSRNNPWINARTISGAPIKGALEFIVEASKYFQLAILSTRNHQYGGTRAMKRWLINEYYELSLMIPVPGWFEDFFISQIQVISPNILAGYNFNKEIKRLIKNFVNEIQFPKHKPPAVLYIDDRAYLFEGTFPDIHHMVNFKRWQE